MADRGRPTLYSDRVLIKARRYVNASYPNKEEVIPTIEGLSLYLRVARATIYAWALEQDKRDFSDIVERLMTKQGKTLANGGISGSFNPTITKLMMSKHGYSDKLDLTSGDKPIPASVTNILNKVYGTDPNTTANPEGAGAPGA